MSDFAQAQYIIDEVLSGVRNMSSDNTGIPPANMKKIEMLPMDGGCKIKFAEPDHTVIDGQVLCTVKGVILIRKQGSMPESVTDGTVVLVNEELGKYKDKAFVDDGLTNDVEYYYRFFSYSDHGVFNLNKANVKAVTPRKYILYGFKINKNNSDPASRISYMEMAEGFTPAHMDYDTGEFDYGSWDPSDIFFLQDNKPWMVKSDGTPDYELDENDYTLRADGTPSDISDVSYDGNAMAKIPLVWMKQWEDDNYEYCYVCNIQLDDDYHAYAHQRADGSIMEYIWLSCFEGAVSSGKLRSIKGLTPANSNSGTAEINYATANGELWYTRSWSQRNLINMLLLLMSCSDDYQTAFGYGYYTGGTSSSPNRLPTGYGSAKGRFYGSKANRDVVKVFHIENWWGDMWERIAGLINNKGKIMVKMTPGYNTTGDGYEDTGLVAAGTSGGYISKTSMTKYGRIGYHAAGSQTTYACDGLWFNNGQVDYALVGGRCDAGFLCGGSCVSLYNLVSGSLWNIGAALSCEQPLAA